MEKYIIVNGSSMRDLMHITNYNIEKGYKPIGGHQAVVKHVQNVYSGMQHKRTENTIEYSQAMIKE